jgi:lipoate-protein ligase A
MVKRGRVLFHGTLLYNTDLQTLDRALRGNELLRGKGVKSVRSDVINLKPLLPEIESVERFVEQLIANLQSYYSK